MATLWLIGASFVLVWIAESLHVAEWFPIGGATGLLISLIILSIIGASKNLTKDDIRSEIRQSLKDKTFWR